MLDIDTHVHYKSIYSTFKHPFINWGCGNFFFVLFLFVVFFFFGEQVVTCVRSGDQF